MQQLAKIDDEEGLATSTHAGLAIQQLLQRILISLPPSIASNKGSPQFKTLVGVVDAFAQADNLGISAGLLEQFQVLQKAFFALESKASRPNVNISPMGQESLQAIAEIQESEADSERPWACEFIAH